MPNNEVKRDYHLTDGELSTFVSNFCSIATRDLLDLTSFGLTEAKITVQRQTHNIIPVGINQFRCLFFLQIL